MEALNKKVFLFGAGAVIDWGGPKTICNGQKLTFLKDHQPPHEITNRVCCLTHMLRETGFDKKYGGKISESIFRHLEERKVPTESLNFETIIGFAEAMFSYYSTDISKRTGIFATQSPEEWIKELLYYETKPVNGGSHHYSFSIPGREFPNDYAVSVETSPEQRFCEYLFHDMLSGIIGHVSKYAYWSLTDNIVDSDVNIHINNAFVNWMQTFTAAGDRLRMYTLNYDRIFKHLLVQNKIEVFEGFETEDSGFEEPGLFIPSPDRVFSGIDKHIFYNLHGCMDWRVMDNNSSGLPAYQYFLSNAPHIETSLAVVEFEKGRKVLLSNIISGYQKVQRTYATPFRQMLASLDRDCLEADEIFMIGYSNSDEHINEIIRNAKKYKPGIKITVINPSFDKEKFMFDFLLHWGNPQSFIYEEDGDNVVASQYGVMAVKKTFGNFLLSRSNL